MKTTTTLLAVFTILMTGMTAVVRAQTTPASPSELLEKGIYAQDTKGDIDSAIAIYQQLVAEQDINHSLAAQAQFRLGQCYLKKNRTNDATAAFQKLAHDYPNETNLITQAREYVPSGLALGPVPWVDRERMQLNITVASGADIGVVEYRADLMHSVGTNYWLVGARLMAGPQSVSSVNVEPETFQPRSSHWKHTMLGEVTAVYTPGEVTIHRVGKSPPEVIPLDGVAYDNEEAVFLMRRLPLQVGYKTTMPVVATLGGNVLSVPLEVVGKETVEVTAGKYNCFKVHLGTVNQDFWFSDDTHRYLVKFEAGGVAAQLTSVFQRQPGEMKFRDDDTGISFSIASDWVVWRARHGQPEGQVLIRTLDPAADADDGGMRLVATDTLSDTARQSARAWMEEALKKNQSARVRPESWKELIIDGRPAVSCVADYGQGSQWREQCEVRVLGSKYSELFVLTSPPEKFDRLNLQFERMITTYRTK